MNNLDAHIEAILFLKGEPMSAKELAKVLDVKEEEVREAADILNSKFEARGIQLLRKEDSFMLSTSPESSEFTKKLAEEEFNSELSKASLEALSIVVYKGPVGRIELDHIRGVNSSYSLRNLMIRGLIERVVNPKDSRSYLYKPSFNLLRYLGIKNVNELPEYKDLKNNIDNFIKEENKKDNEQEDSSINSDI